MKKAKSLYLYFPNTFYHIYNRGNHKERIFWECSDYSKFLNILRKNERRFNLTIYGYCLMPNHYHILIKSGSEKECLTKFVHSCMTSYSMFINRKYQLVGHLFQGPFQVKLLDNNKSIEKVIDYLKENPIKADLVRNADDYKWLDISIKYVNI